MLSERVIRASWECERDDIERRLVDEMKFNPKAAPLAANNFIESMVFARIPNTTEAGIAAAWNEYKRDTSPLRKLSL